MEEEIWKDIEGYEGYQVSSEGRVRSVDRVIEYKDGAKHIWRGQLLKLTNIRGYNTILLRKNGKGKRHQVHRLVAKAFIQNPDNLPECNHKDENPQNNNVNNLEWCDHKYNINYGTRTERVSCKNINNPKYSKKVYQYTLDNQLVKVWESMHECERNGFDRQNIRHCCKGEHKYHKGFRWSYTPLEANIVS